MGVDPGYSGYAVLDPQDQVYYKLRTRLEYREDFLNLLPGQCWNWTFDLTPGEDDGGLTGSTRHFARDIIAHFLQECMDCFAQLATIPAPVDIETDTWRTWCDEDATVYSGPTTVSTSVSLENIEDWNQLLYDIHAAIDNLQWAYGLQTHAVGMLDFVGKYNPGYYNEDTETDTPYRPPSLPFPSEWEDGELSPLSSYSLLVRAYRKVWYTGEGNVETRRFRINRCARIFHFPGPGGAYIRPSIGNVTLRLSYPRSDLLTVFACSVGTPTGCLGWKWLISISDQSEYDSPDDENFTSSGSQIFSSEDEILWNGGAGGTRHELNVSGLVPLSAEGDVYVHIKPIEIQNYLDYLVEWNPCVPGVDNYTYRRISVGASYYPSGPGIIIDGQVLAGFADWLIAEGKTDPTPP